MKEFTYTVTDPLGLHARPAGLLVKECKKYASAIQLHNGEKGVDATRLMSVLGLGVKQGDALRVTAEGEDEGEAIAALKAYCEENL